MQSAGYLVASTAEFSSGVQYGKHNLYCRLAGLVIDAGRDSTSVICHGDGIAWIDQNLDIFTKSGKCFIYGIVHNLIDKMVQSP